MGFLLTIIHITTGAPPCGRWKSAAISWRQNRLVATHLQGPSRWWRSWWCSILELQLLCDFPVGWFFLQYNLPKMKNLLQSIYIYMHYIHWFYTFYIDGAPEHWCCCCCCCWWWWWWWYKVIWVLFKVIWLIFPIGNPPELGNLVSEYVIFFGDPESANPSISYHIISCHISNIISSDIISY